MYDQSYFTKIEEEETTQAGLLARVLIDHYRPSSVFDLGCATGLYLLPFHNAEVQICGMDSAPAAFENSLIPVENFLLRDATIPLPINIGKWDMALCIEVLEHVEAEKGGLVLDNLCALSDRLIVSAAQPGAGGVGHVNCQPKHYWRRELARRGFYYDHATTMLVLGELIKCEGADRITGWLLNNTMIFEQANHVKSDQPETDITVTITSCGRFGLLKKTIDSLLATAGMPLRIIINDDSGDQRQHAKIMAEYGKRFDVYLPARPQGLAWSLDFLYSLVDTPYHFHCEDDWEFLQVGYLEKSRAVLAENPDVAIVGLVKDERFERAGAVGEKHETSTGVVFYEHSAWRLSDRHAWWYGWIGSPNLKRTADHADFLPFSQTESEAGFDQSVWRCSEKRSVWLEDKYVQHIGQGHSVQEQTTAEFATPRLWTAPASIKPRLRFHLLGLAHIPTRRTFMSCAYTQKVVKLAIMLKSLGHYVTVYGVEGSDVECDEFVSVLPAEKWSEVYGGYDWRTEFFKHDPNDEAHQVFNRNAIKEINERKRPGDFLLCPMGNYQKPIADAVPGLKAVEPGVGYYGVFTPYRVFESYAWMNWVYGSLRQDDGSWYDAVIPNYFDPLDFPYQETKKNYALFLGRLIQRKGIDVAVQVTRELGIPLIVAGQGSLINPVERLNITDPHVSFVGSVGPEVRAHLMGNARMVLMPTYYNEPFGGVAVEAMFCGTPVLTTDWGVFPETILHGVTGYRCRTFEEFLWAAKNVGNLNPQDCRDWAVKNYSMDRVRWMYDAYFARLANLDTDKGWYTKHNGRRELDWLKRFYPVGA